MRTQPNARVQAGVPAGGQFAVSTRVEPSVALEPDAGPSLNHAIKVTAEGKEPVCGAPSGRMDVGGVTCSACMDAFNPR